MPSKENTENLLLVAAELRQNELGDRFFKVLGQYVGELKDELVKSPLDQIQVRLGIARQGEVLLQLFVDAPVEARKILDARERQNARSKV